MDKAGFEKINACINGDGYLARVSPTPGPDENFRFFEISAGSMEKGIFALNSLAAAGFMDRSSDKPWLRAFPPTAADSGSYTNQNDQFHFLVEDQNVRVF